jgi:enoyl-CoA hydratase/carnithine racemase
MEIGDLSMTKKQESVQVEVLTGKKGSLGVLTLNSPKTLNSLSLEMVEALLEQMRSWQDDAEIACVVLKGAGEKAFCAGGDVQELYRSATKTPGGPCEEAEKFFYEEYQLDYLIHTYGKPVICIGHGIVMGGGLGLMAGASHRIVTDSTHIAMPEITIGLFPDVGGTYFLNRMPEALGRFFGLTGAKINANDAIYLELADYFISGDKLDDFLEALTNLSWGKKAETNHAAVSEFFESRAASKEEIEQAVASELAPCLSEVRCACYSESLGEFVRYLEQIELDSKWFSKAVKTMQAGSPLSLLMSFEQLRRHKYDDLKSVFESELVLATNIVRYPEFTEGVRALLIEKDKKPKWQFKHFSEVPASLMERLFTPPWNPNPLSEVL